MTNKPNSLAVLLALLLPASLPVPLQAQESRESIERSFNQAANDFIACLGSTVKMGMSTKMDPQVFKEGFAKSCLEQEEAFRNATVELGLISGRTKEDVLAEVNGNIANGRKVFAADQEEYIRTGRVPR